jgi:hypothetical protein
VRAGDLSTDWEDGVAKTRPSDQKKAIQEAMAGIEAVKQDLIPGAPPIKRDPSGDFEFKVGEDPNAKYWDVKTPPSRGLRTPEEVAKAGMSIKKQLLTADGVILDTTYMTDEDLFKLRKWLKDNLTDEELDKIVEINTQVD